MNNRLAIINDGRDYFLVETFNYLTAERQQELLKEGNLTRFTPVYRFTFLDKFRKSFYSLLYEEKVK